MVEDDEVASVQGFRKSIPPGRSLVALCAGVPKAVVGVEITHDEGRVGRRVGGGKAKLEFSKAHPCRIVQTNHLWK